jgi:hypothetical protein
MSPREWTGNGYDVLGGRRPSDRHPLLLGEQSAANGNVDDTDAQKPMIFSVVRVTGLKSPDDWHNTGLTVIQEDDDHLTQEWSYQFKDKTGKNIFHFMRVRLGTS